MLFYAIPFEDVFILYRPLKQIAFVGNRVMADLGNRICAGEPVEMPDEVRDFLDSIGFFEPDPPAPAPINLDFRPTTAVLLLTNRCNLRCLYCYADAGSFTPEDLTFDLAKPVIDAACKNAQTSGRPQFDISFHGGGEPMQAWDLIQEVVIYARSLPLKAHISMVSNGLWSEKQRRYVLENLDGVSISCDGRPETQDRMRPTAGGQASSSAVFETIAALDTARFDYGIRMTATAPWGESLADDVRYLCEHTACPIIQIEPAFNDERGRHRRPTEKEAMAFVDGFMAAYEVGGRYGRQVLYSGARPWLTVQAFCTAPYDALIVNAHGDLVTCYEIASGDHALARLSTIGHLTYDTMEIDPVARAELHTRLDLKRESCRSCFCYWHCAGDCYARTQVYENNAFISIDSRCLINQEISKRLLLHKIMANDGFWRGSPPQGREMRLMKQF